MEYSNHLSAQVVGRNAASELVELGKARVYSTAADQLIARGNTGELTRIYLAAAAAHAQIAAVQATDRDYV